MNFQVSQITNIHFLEHVVVTTSLTVHGFVTGYESRDFYNELHYSHDIDEVYQWMENSHPRRGDIRIILTSPQGTESVLLPYRNYDFVNEEGYDNWPFMSVHHWGENPTGQWTLSINFRSSSGYVSMSDLALTLYGTAVTPQNITTRCSTQCSRGCSGPTPQDCDACTNLRIASTLDCVSECPNGTHEYHSYCLDGEATSGSHSTIHSGSDVHTTPSYDNPTFFSVSHSPGSNNGGNSHVAIIAGSVASLGAVLIICVVSFFCIAQYIRYRKHRHQRGRFSFLPLEDPVTPTTI